MEALKGRAQHAASQEEFWREADLVWREYGITDKAKLAWLVLRRLGLDRRQQDIDAVALAGWIGKRKEARGHEAIEELVEAGLLCHDRMNEEKRSDRCLRGRYLGCSLNDPAAVQGPRRQPCHRTGERDLPGVAWHDLGADAQTGPPVDVVRIAPAGDAPPAAPNRQAGPAPAAAASARFGPKSGASSTETAGQSAGFGSKSGAFATSTSTSSKDLNHTSTSSGTDRRSNYTAGVGSEGSAGFGAKSGACAGFGNLLAAASERLLARPSLLTVEGLAAEFPAAPTATAPNAPRDWAEACAIAVREALSGGRGFGADELAECVAATKDKLSAGTLRGPAWVFCRGAIQRKYRRLGIPWPKFKPRPR